MTAMRPVVLAAVGDVLVNRPEPEEVLSSVEPLLREADITFGNFEGVLSDVHAATPGSSTSMIAGTANATPLNSFSILSLANNHSMDAGYGGLNSTLERLAAVGVASVGAGSELTSALAPHVTEHGGLRIAMLAVTAVLAIGVEARETVAGVAPLRAEDCWAPASPGYCTPGVPPRIFSILNERDWENLEQAIAAVRSEVDIVVVSVHWGDHTRPWVLTDHERLCAELLAEAKVDLVLGHHQHILRGVEFIEGMPVCYGLGNFVLDIPGYADELRWRGLNVDDMTPRMLAEQLGEYGIFPRQETPAYPFHEITRTSAITIAELSKEGVTRCGMVPCRIDASGVPRLVSREEGAWEDTLSFLRDCAEKGHLASRVVDSGWTYAGHDVLEWTPAEG